MAGFDLLVYGSEHPKIIKQYLINVFGKKDDESFFYYDSSELISASKKVTLLIGCYKKEGDVDWLLSIEHDLHRDEKSLASEIAKSIRAKCYLPDNYSLSDESYIEYSPEIEKGRNVKLMENDEGNYFELKNTN